MNDSEYHMDVVRISSIIREKAKECKLLCEVELEDKDIQFIRNNFNHIVSDNSIDDDCIVLAYALMDYGLSQYTNNYWKNLKADYGIDKNKALERFDKAIDRLGLNNGIKTERSRERILIQAFVPESSLDDFFRFVYNYCVNVLDYDLSDLDTSFKELSEFVKAFNKCNQETSALEEYEDLPIPWTIPACTRYVLMKPELFSGILDKFMHNIVELEDGGLIRPEDECMFTSRYIEWFKERKRMGRIQGIRDEYRKKTRMKLMGDGSLAFRIPAQTFCPLDSKLMVKVNNVDIENVPQPQFFCIQRDKQFVRQEFILQAKDFGIDVSPFDDISIYLGKEIYRTKARRKFILFDEHSLEIDHPVVGITKVLFRDDCHIIPEDRIISEDGKITVLSLRDGDVLSISGSDYKVGGNEKSLNSISISKNSILSADFHNQTLSVTTDNSVAFNIVSRTRTPVLHIRVNGGDEQTRLVRRDSVDDYFKSGPDIFFRLDLNQFTQVLSIVDLKVTILDATIQNSTFVYVPDYEPTFDKSFYVDSTSGILTLNENQEISFNISCFEEPVITWNEPIGGDEMTFHALVPVISLDYGYGLKGPGDYDVKRRDLLQGKVRMIFGSDSRVSMYVEGCKSKPTLSIDSKGYRYYNLGEILDEIDADPKKNYGISLSIDSKPRFHIARIYTTNNYSVNIQERTIKMDASAGNKSMVFLMKGRELISSSRLNVGVNTFSSLQKKTEKYHQASLPQNI